MKMMLITTQKLNSILGFINQLLLSHVTVVTFFPSFLFFCHVLKNDYCCSAAVRQRKLPQSQDKNKLVRKKQPFLHSPLCASSSNFSPVLSIQFLLIPSLLLLSIVRFSSFCSKQNELNLEAAEASADTDTRRLRRGGDRQKERNGYQNWKAEKTSLKASL